MFAEKLPSGNYRVRKMIDGHRVSVVFDHKPTRKEMEEDFMKAYAEKVTKKSTSKMSVKDAMKEYNATKKNILKPNTYREYTLMIDRFPKWFLELQISSVDQAEINRCMNEFMEKRSAKTVRNYHAYLSSILATYKPDFIIRTTLPKKHKKEPYIPSDDDIKKILAELQDTEFYIPVVLASFGMRRGEICALTVDDIENDIVHINKSLSLNEKREWVIDTTKTVESDRDIIIPMKIADMIREKGYVYKGHPNAITEKLYKVQKKLGIERFSVHKMRHYFASTLSAHNVPEADILALGGWKTDNVMKNIYRHSMLGKKESKKRKATSHITKSIM